MNKVINYSMYANLPYRQEDVMDLKGRDFLTLKDYTPEEILYLIDLAAELKDKKKKGKEFRPLDKRQSCSAPPEACPLHDP